MINVLYVTFIFACVIVHFQTKAPVCPRFFFFLIVFMECREK
jgi:hypothetical protein